MKVEHDMIIDDVFFKLDVLSLAIRGLENNPPNEDEIIGLGNMVAEIKREFEAFEEVLHVQRKCGDLKETGSD